MSGGVGGIVLLRSKVRTACIKVKSLLEIEFGSWKLEEDKLTEVNS